MGKKWKGNVITKREISFCFLIWCYRTTDVRVCARRWKIFPASIRILFVYSCRASTPVVSWIQWRMFILLLCWYFGRYTKLMKSLKMKINTWRTIFVFKTDTMLAQSNTQDSRNTQTHTNVGIREQRWHTSVARTHVLTHLTSPCRWCTHSGTSECSRITNETCDLFFLLRNFYRELPGGGFYLPPWFRVFVLGRVAADISVGE